MIICPVCWQRRTFKATYGQGQKPKGWDVTAPPQRLSEHQKGRQGKIPHKYEPDYSFRPSSELRCRVKSHGSYIHQVFPARVRHSGGLCRWHSCRSRRGFSAHSTPSSSPQVLISIYELPHVLSLGRCPRGQKSVFTHNLHSSTRLSFTLTCTHGVYEEGGAAEVVLRCLLGLFLPCSPP